MWQYDPKQANTCWPKGFYKGQLFSVVEKPRPNTDGDTMLEVTYKAWNGQQTQLVTEYFTREPVSMSRYKRLAGALGKREEFKAGTFDPAQLIDAPLVLCLTIEESQQYGDKNKVAGHEARDWTPSEEHYAKGWQAPDFRKLGAGDFK